MWDLIIFCTTFLTRIALVNQGQVGFVRSLDQERTSCKVGYGYAIRWFGFESWPLINWLDSNGRVSSPFGASVSSPTTEGYVYLFHRMAAGTEGNLWENTLETTDRTLGVNRQSVLGRHWLRAMKDSATLDKMVMERQGLDCSTHPWKENYVLTSTRRAGQKLNRQTHKQTKSLVVGTGRRAVL